MTDDSHPTAAQLSADPQLVHWRVLLGRLVARWETGGFAAGARFAARIAEVADQLDHHPDVDLRYPHVTVTTISHDVGRLTERDRKLAVAVSGLAEELGLRAVPDQLSVLEIGLDVMVGREVMPFWRAVLGYELETPEEDEPALIDPAGRHAGLWFQQMEEARTERNRFHLDVTVPHDVAEERVRRALEAGGRLVTDAYAPSWWVLADPEGNEACICTWQGRGQGDAALSAG